MSWILLLEDERLVARLLARRIKARTGLRVVHASCLQQVRQRLQSEAELPRAAILDYRLPLVPEDGVDVWRELRRCAPIPTAFCSSEPPWIMQERLKSEGLGAAAPCFAKLEELDLLMQWLAAAVGTEPTAR